jgi:hypothetical protein
MMPGHRQYRRSTSDRPGILRGVKQSYTTACNPETEMITMNAHRRTVLKPALQLETLDERIAPAHLGIAAAGHAAVAAHNAVHSRAAAHLHSSAMHASSARLAATASHRCNGQPSRPFCQSRIECDAPHLNWPGGRLDDAGCAERGPSCDHAAIAGVQQPDRHPLATAEPHAAVAYFGRARGTDDDHPANHHHAAADSHGDDHFNCARDPAGEFARERGQ